MDNAMRTSVHNRAVAVLRGLSISTWLAVGLQWLAGSRWPGPLPGIDLLLCLATGVSAAAALIGSLRWDGLQRWGLLLLSSGIAAYAVGYLVLFYDPSNQRDGFAGVNLSDCISLLLYPLAYLGLSLLAWGRHGRHDRTALIEGAVIASGAAAVTVLVASRLYPTLMVGPAVTVVYDLAYPVGGLTLLIGCVTSIAVTGFRADRVWGWLIAGFTCMTVGDFAYGFAAAAHRFRFGTWSEILYAAGPLGVALAATRRPAELPAKTDDPRPAMVVSGIATLTAIGTLVVGDLGVIPRAATVLAAGCGVLAVVRTALFLTQDRLLRHNQALARTDQLTALPNRRALVEALERASSSPDHHALILLDLDRFKDINDTFGHAAGDQVLTVLARQLVAQASQSGVYRLGGDEFAILHAGPVEGALVLAHALRGRRVGPIPLDGTLVTVDATFGVGPISLDSDPVRMVGESLRRADVALYRAKASGTGVAMWDSGFDTSVQERLQLAQDLRVAVAAGDQLVVHFQPQAEASTGRILSFEALVRWQHPRLGLLPPLSFLKVAATGGMLPAITRFVLATSLAALGELRQVDPALSIAVNVGADDLLDRCFPDQVAAQLHAAGIPPGRLVVEVTESIVLHDPDRVISALERLRSSGVRVALDDYGTGLASLSYLRRLPLDEMKIDRSLVADLESDSSSALIISSAVQLAHGLGLKVTVEGVEEPSAAALLATMGCDSIQGWLVGRSLPLRDALSLLSEPATPLPRA